MEEAGFKKIDLSSTPIATESAFSKSPGKQHKMSGRRFPKFGKKGLGIVGVVLILLAIFGIFTGVQAFGIYKQARKVEAQARLAAAAAKTQNVVLAREELVKTKTEA